MAQSSQSASQLQLEALRPMGERLDAPATYRSYFIGSYLMRKTRLGAGWTKSPRPVLQGQSAASPTVRRAATYKMSVEVRHVAVAAFVYFALNHTAAFAQVPATQDATPQYR